MKIQPWNLVFLAGFILYISIRGIYGRRTKGNEKTVSRLDAQDQILMGLVGTGNVLLPVLYLFTPWLAFADYRLPEWAPWCGVIVMSVALWLFWRAHADLDRNWSITLELRKGHQLITHGVYRAIRHPMYAAILLFGLAQGLLLQNWLAGWSAAVTFAVMYIGRVRREEQMMCEFFGEKYREYMRQTGRLFPRLKLRNE